ncbi:hypothetical protein OB983_15595 [Bacillus cereus]|nr:hypothetical protein [Bacillus cereus]
MTGLLGPTKTKAGLQTITFNNDAVEISKTLKDRQGDFGNLISYSLTRW